MKKEMTNAELVTAIKKKLAKASPSVKRHTFSSLKYMNKAELRRWLQKAKVTREGDISLI